MLLDAGVLITCTMYAVYCRMLDPFGHWSSGACRHIYISVHELPVYYTHKPRLVVTEPIRAVTRHLILVPRDAFLRDLVNRQACISAFE
jgi:hypothetical protein